MEIYSIYQARREHIYGDIFYTISKKRTYK
jgi:hypothetical protein